MRLCLVTPAWRRYAVTRLCLAQRRHLVEVLAGRGLEATVLVIANDDNLDIAAEQGFETLERSNDMLGRKFNDGIETAFTVLAADYVAVVGSDDWIHPDMFDRLPAEEIGDPEMIGDVVAWTPGAPEAVSGREIAMVDMIGGRLRRCRGRGPFGVIPWVFPRPALEPCGFRPARDDLHRGIDGSMAAGLGGPVEWVFHDPHDLCRVDFKSDVNLNSYAAITGAIGYGPEETDPWALLATRYPQPLVDEARQLSEVMA